MGSETGRIPDTEMTSQMLDLQVADGAAELPAESSFRKWVAAALEATGSPRHEVSIRVVDEDEIRRMNRDFRGKDTPTNVLSFGFDPIPGVETGHLGDLAICHTVVAAEAAAQVKAPEAHWAHMVVHGVLHLCGFDHQADADACNMEDLETRILTGLGFADPYGDIAPGDPVSGRTG